MSIKGFHLIFIVIAAIFSGGFGTWVFLLDERERSLGLTIGGVLTIVASVLLLAYGVYFYRKSKSIIV